MPWQSYNTQTGVTTNYNGNTPDSGVASTSAGSSGNSGNQQNQILNLAAMSQYSPSQYTRQANGAVILNAGVTPIAGTTRTIGSGSTGSNGVPYGATPITNPAGLQGLTESQIYRDPSGRIYKLSTSGSDQIIATDPFLSEQMKDPTLKAWFDTITDESLKAKYLGNLKALEASIEAGKVLNPNIELTPDEIRELEHQASDFIDPYYNEQIDSWKQDLQISLDRLQEDYNNTIAQEEGIFKDELSNQANAEADAGLAFSSGRGVRLNKKITEENQQLSDLATSKARSAQDLGIQAERALGSRAVSRLGYNFGVGNYSASEGGLSRTGSRSLFSPGNLSGSIANEQATSRTTRANQLISDARANRVLDYNLLTR